MVLAADHRELPSREALLARVTLDVGDRRAAWLRMGEEAARASIACVLLLQTALQRCGLSAARLSRTATGRPELETAGVDLSLSHSAHHAVCALLIGEGRIGVDAEELRGDRDPARLQAMAERWLTGADHAYFAECPDETRFLELWTGKEAMSKADGRGLSVLRELSVTVPPEGYAVSCERLGALVLSVVHPKAETCGGAVLLQAEELL